MQSIQEMMQELKVVTDRRQALVSIQTSGKDARQFTPEEQVAFHETTSSMNHLQKKISERRSQNTILNMLDTQTGFPLWVHDPNAATRRPDHRQKPMSAEYGNAFLAFLRSGGKQATDTLMEGFDPLFGGYALPVMPGMSSVLYGGSGGSSDAAGGYAVNLPTDNLIVPLGVPDLGVRSVSMVVPTATDVKIPGQAAFSTAGIKLESGSSTYQFSESDPTLAQFTLSAYMIGLSHVISWELLADVPMFQQFAIGDLLNAIDIAEDAFFVTGNGSGQPQGLVGNTGTGTGSAYAVESTGQYLLDSTTDVQGTLKASYFRNAGWLMSRSTATAIRKAQQQANLFAPVWTREGGRDLLHGFPVTYSQNMPALPTATTAGVTPILFGSFSDGYIIGDRGGVGTFVKILDQPLAQAGQTVLLGYKRVDGRVRRSEAIQGISISHS